MKKNAIFVTVMLAIIVLTVPTFANETGTHIVETEIIVTTHGGPSTELGG